jgi:hypothetical protein
MDNAIKVGYSVKGNNLPIQFFVPPNPWLSTINDGTKLVITRPGTYYITADRSHIPPMFRNQIRFNITDGANNKIGVKGVNDKYVATLIVDQTEIGTPTSKFSAVMNAPLMPAFNGTLEVIPGPLPY